MAVLTDVDARTVARGVALQVALTLPPVLVIRALTQDDLADESFLPVVAAAIALFVAPAMAAAHVARRRPETPVLHAGVTTAAGWLVLSLVTVVRLWGRPDHGIDAITVLPLLALIEVGVGLTTAYVTTRSGREPAP